MRNNPIKRQWKCNITSAHVVLRETSPVDSFYREELKPKHDETGKAYAYVDPIIMLFNAERLNQIGADSATQWLDSLNKYKSSSLDELRKKCSDEDLMQLIKSRHIQAPAEILAWARQQELNMQDFENEVKQLMQQKFEEQKKTSTSDVVETTSVTE